MIFSDKLFKQPYRHISFSVQLYAVLLQHLGKNAAARHLCPTKSTIVNLSNAAGRTAIFQKCVLHTVGLQHISKNLATGNYILRDILSLDVHYLGTTIQYIFGSAAMYLHAWSGNRQPSGTLRTAGQETTVDWSIIGDRKELDILGSHLSPYAYPFVIENISNGKLKTNGVVSTLLPFTAENWKKGFELATGKDGDFKVAFLFE